MADRNRNSLWHGLIRLLLSARTRRAVPIKTPESQDVIAQLHAVEYEVLSNRISSWTTLQFSIVGLVVAVLIDFLKQPVDHLRVWLVTITLQILIGAYCYTLFEIMNATSYIEKKLAPKICDAFRDLNKMDFWGYERYKKGNRVYPPSGIYIMMLYCIGFPYAALLYFRPWYRGSLDYPLLRDGIDYAFTTLSIGIAFFTFRIARKAVLAQEQLAP